MTDRYSRNEGLFGKDGQRRLAGTRVAIVGLGGLGSHLAQQLAYLGVLQYALVDFDLVTTSSLNRLVGATPDDAVAGTPKVVVAARTIRTIQPDAEIDPIEGALIDARAVDAVAAADVLFGAVDRDVHRVDLLEVAARSGTPYFDLATDTAGDQHEIYGGRVVLSDGTQCLVCLPEVLNQEAIGVERLPVELRDAHDRTYGIRRDALDQFGPSVVSINGVVASLSVTEFMVRTTGLRKPQKHLIYRADHGIVRASRDEPVDGCYYCTAVWPRQT